MTGLREPAVLDVIAGPDRYSVGAPSLAGALLLVAKTLAPGVEAMPALIEREGATSEPGWCLPCLAHCPAEGQMLAVPGCSWCVWVTRDDDADALDVANRMSWVSGLGCPVPTGALILASKCVPMMADDDFVAWSVDSGLDLARALRR